MIYFFHFVRVAGKIEITLHLGIRVAGGNEHDAVPQSCYRGNEHDAQFRIRAAGECEPD